MSRKVSPSWFSLLYLALLLLAASLVQKPLQREMSRLQQKRSSLRQMATLMQAENGTWNDLRKRSRGGEVLTLQSSCLDTSRRELR